MRICIHRGASEIGGNTVEIETNGQRIVLDLGRPLAATLRDDVSLPEIVGLQGEDKTLLGVFITHGHPDHYGLINRVSRRVPLYVGAATSRILAEAAFYTPTGAVVTPSGFLVDRKPLEVGPFRMTPFLVDHSAFDAYALLVEADGKGLLYSGDLRSHGRKGLLFERLVRDPPSQVDVLLLEGTRIAEDEPARRGLGSEDAVEEAVLQTMQTAPGFVLALFSPQNIDRLVSFYRAARRANRTLVLDLYAAAVSAATGVATIPQADWEGVRVYVTQTQRVLVKNTASFARLGPIGRSRIFLDELAAAPDRFVLIFRSSMWGELEPHGCLTGASAIWSMWPGYLSTPAGEQLKQRLERQRVPLVIHHASGHAPTPDLKRFALAVGAKRVVPIHTTAPEAYVVIEANVEVRNNGEWWQI